MTEVCDTEVPIKLSWKVLIEGQECRNIIVGYKITYWTTGQSLKSKFIKWENQTEMSASLEDLIPGAKYLIVIFVKYTNDSIPLRRTLYVPAGKGLITESSPTAVPTKDSSVNGGGIAGGVVASVLVVMIVIIALISVWLVYRRRKWRNRNGLYYISIVHGIGNVSRRGRLHSRPGYLQIVHDAPCAGYEVPRSSVNIRPQATTLLTNETEYPRRELHGCADSNSSINSVQVTTEPIQMRMVSSRLVSSRPTDGHTDNVKVTQPKRKLVKPYAIVDVKDIGSDSDLGTSRGLLDRLKLKRQKQEELPSNREALKKSFTLSLHNNITPAEQHTSTGRYYTVPIYVNLNIPMTVNPSYKKNKV